MEINEQVLEKLDKLSVPKKDALSYLVGLYFNCVASTTSDRVKVQVSMTDIFELTKKGIKWNYSLFGITQEENKWQWVINEYREMFKTINAKRTGPKNSSISRMKKFFSENPDVRKDEVLGATRMYIRNLTSAEYITSAHYFIFKGSGANRVSGLEDWVDKYKTYMAVSNSNSDDITNSMQ